MEINSVLYILSDTTQHVPEGDDAWILDLKNQGIICDCWNFLKRQPIDIYLSEKIKKSFAPITYARGTKIGMIRNDVVSLIGYQLLENVYYIGSVFEKGGKRSDNYISLVPKAKEAYVRGGTESTCKKCDLCGTLLYFALPLGTEYITINQIQNNSLFPCYGITEIIVNEFIYKTLKQSGIKKIGYKKLSIRENAIDGLHIPS